MSGADYVWSQSKATTIGFYPKDPNEKFLKDFMQRSNTLNVVFYKDTPVVVSSTEHKKQIY